jgi:hypothetical protein
MLSTTPEESHGCSWVAVILSVVCTADTDVVVAWPPPASSVLLPSMFMVSIFMPSNSASF